jgi:hypothetical protein
MRVASLFLVGVFALSPAFAATPAIVEVPRTS